MIHVQRRRASPQAHLSLSIRHIHIHYREVSQLFVPSVSTKYLLHIAEKHAEYRIVLHIYIDSQNLKSTKYSVVSRFPCGSFIPPDTCRPFLYPHFDGLNPVNICMAMLSPAQPATTDVLLCYTFYKKSEEHLAMGARSYCLPPPDSWSNSIPSTARSWYFYISSGESMAR